MELDILVSRQRHVASGAAIIVSLLSAVCILERFICVICIMDGGRALPGYEYLVK